MLNLEIKGTSNKSINTYRTTFPYDDLTKREPMHDLKLYSLISGLLMTSSSSVFCIDDDSLSVLKASSQPVDLMLDDTMGEFITPQLMPILTMSLAIDFSGILDIGKSRIGTRKIQPVSGGNFVGPNLQGTVLPGNDWVVVRNDGSFSIDVRLTLSTDDGALIYLAYTGRFLAGPEALAKFRQGLQLEAEEYSLAVTGHFETGYDKYQWLNDLIITGVGRQSPAGVTYSFYGFSN